MPRKRVSENAKREFAKRLRNRAIDLGLNQSELAREVDKHLPPGKTMGRDAVSHYWRGIAIPLEYRLKALSGALRCDMRDLIPRDDGPFQVRRVGGLAHVSIDYEVPFKVFKQIEAVLAPYVRPTIRR